MCIDGEIFLGTNETAFYVGVFSILEPSYWLLLNKQPIEIGAQISLSTNRKIVSFVPAKILIHHR